MILFYLDIRKYYRDTSIRLLYLYTGSSVAVARSPEQSQRSTFVLRSLLHNSVPYNNNIKLVYSSSRNWIRAIARSNGAHTIY